MLPRTEDMIFTFLFEEVVSKCHKQQKKFCETFEAGEVVLACTMRSAGLCSCQCVSFVRARMKA
jgi:hypothetical protein